MLNVLQFNWPWYAAALLATLAAAVGLRWLALPGVLARMLLVVAACSAFWALGSLLASHWVYDLSPLSRWEWLRSQFTIAPTTAVNIHAGFDETSGYLQGLFPNTVLTVWNIFDAGSMTEGSIHRARQMQDKRWSAASVNSSRLPATDATFDAVFLIFAAHELRSRPARQRFFSELFRALRPGGVLVLVEHLRDWENLAAYGPGFLHFLSRGEWLGLAAKAGFPQADEFSITPFVRVFRLTKPHDQ